MADALWSCLVFLLLCAAALAGRLLFGHLPAGHRTRETLDHTRLVSNLLVTFAALVLGLLTTSVNGGFEAAGRDVGTFGADLVRLTSSLEQYGPATLPIRRDLRRYTAAAIASTWPEEPRPTGEFPQARADEDDFDSLELGALLHRAATAVMALEGGDAVQAALRTEALARIEHVEDLRWRLIGEAHHTISAPFLDVTLFWLVMIFIGFGLNAPPNALALTCIVLAAVCVSAAIFVLLELDGPLDGLVKVSSEPLRHALRHLDASLSATAPAAPRG